MSDRLYVNIYDHGRAYGGPEEGGWWFDVGTPIGSIPIELTDEERKSIHSVAIATHGEDLPNVDPELYAKHFENYLNQRAQAICLEYEKRYPRTGNASSVLGGEDHLVCIERHFARAYPQEKPHYE